MIKEKLEKLIMKAFQENGFECKSCEITAAKGHWRTSHYADVYRFEGSAQVNGRTQIVNSWVTMTKCLKHGIILAPDGAQHWLVEIKTNETEEYLRRKNGDQLPDVFKNKGADDASPC